MIAADELTVSALTVSEVKTLRITVAPDDVAMLQCLADGLRALNTDEVGGARWSRD